MRVGEVVSHVDLVVGVWEVFHPAGGVGVDVEDAGVHEVVESLRGRGWSRSRFVRRR